MIFAYFAQDRTFEKKNLGPTKLCCILHWIHSTATTDQRECGVWIVDLLIFLPFPSK